MRNVADTAGVQRAAELMWVLGVLYARVAGVLVLARLSRVVAHLVTAAMRGKS